MRNFYYLLLILFSFQYLYAQNGLLTKEEIEKQYEAIKNPTSDEDINKVEDLIVLSEKINYKEGIISGNVKKLYFFYNRSDYKKMLEIIRQTEALGVNNSEVNSKLSIYKSYANGALGIQKEEFKNIKDALKFAEKIEDTDRKHYQLSTVYNRFSIYYDYKIPDSLIYYLKKELTELEKMSDGPDIRIGKYSSIALNNINIGNYYRSVHTPPRLDLAEPYFMKVYNYRTTQPEVFKIHDMAILCGVGEFYLSKGDYQKSVELFKEVL